MIFEKIQLEPSEEVLLLVRRHWFYLFIHGVPLVLIALLPLLIGFIGVALFGEVVSPFIVKYTLHILFLYAGWLLIIWMILASVWTEYYLDIWCVTNRRIIQIDQIALFRRKTGSFRLERMQDVNVEINGVIATLLDYGTVRIQTASADLDDFTAVFIPKPQEVKALILKAGDELLDKSTTNL